MDGLVKKAVNAIIRPPRSEYNCNEMPLILDAGGDQKFMRHPVSFKNPRKQNIVGSIYFQSNFSPVNGGPCIIYLHGNASCQTEGQFLVPNFCPHGCFVFCFDFVGCGCSDGDYVSLGYFETQDTNFLINLLHKQFNMGPFILWGRSMGAATALLVDNPYVVAKISDSSFTSVPDMCAAIAKSMSLPSMFIPAVIWFLKKKVLSAADFDIEQISPLDCEQESPVPVVFGHAQEDQFIPFEQCRELYDSYENPHKYIMVLEGGHNSKRDIGWITLGVTFALEQLSIDTTNIQISECRKLQSASFHFGSFETLLKSAREDEHTATQEEINEFNKALSSQPNPAEQPKTEKKHRHRHLTPEEREEFLRRKAEKHALNEIKRAKKREKREREARKAAKKAIQEATEKALENIRKAEAEQSNQ